ncbi:hypothetical protein [Flavobacterium sp. LAR06]|uniref:hypothetical protein n=1 Tax=Flavobacterium sp. LAR06 TaxID=3064897 RepID=UPI0035C0AAA8
MKDLLKMSALALVGGKIFLWWGSPQKIGRTAVPAPENTHLLLFEIVQQKRGFSYQKILI